MRAAAMIVFLLTCSLEASGAAPAGEWTWDQGASSYFAGTSNDTGDTFGQACYPGERKCYWVIVLKRSCNPGATHPTLVNTDAGASTFQLTCMGPSEERGAFRYSISEFDEIDHVVAGATRIGFALPLRGDQFTLTRFDLSGSKPVVSAMRQAAEAQMRAQPAR
jgi:hypothetical protein